MTIAIHKITKIIKLHFTTMITVIVVILLMMTIVSTMIVNGHDNDNYDSHNK
jgi:hypothetical protein